MNWSRPLCIFVLMFSLAFLGIFTLHAVENEPAPNKAQRNLLEQSKAALEKQDPESALALLEKWQGAPHSLHYLLRGHSLRQLDNTKAAIGAYAKSLSLNPRGKTAALSLIDIYASTEAWQELRPLLEQWVDVDNDELPLIKIKIYCARELKDLRWAEAIIQRAVLRFPDNQELRQIDIAVLIDAERWDEAESAVEQALQSQGQDPRLWQYLSYIYQTVGKTDLALAASEAASLLDPTNNKLRLQFAQAQLAAGHAGEAFQQINELVKTGPVTQETLHIAAQAAYAAGKNTQAKQFLERLAAMKEGGVLSESAQRNIQRLSLRVLVDDKAYDELDKRVDALLALKKLDSQTLLWLAQNAEQREAAARAEMLYQLLRVGEDREAALANLYLARLWYSQGRKQQAQNLLRQHLKQHPLDEYAQRLMGLMQ